MEQRNPCILVQKSFPRAWRLVQLAAGAPARPTRWVRAGVQPVGSGPQAIGTAAAIGTPPGLELSAVFPNLSRASETLGIPKSTLYDYVKGRAACFKLMESPLLYNI
jgi:hypothetical protein